MASAPARGRPRRGPPRPSGGRRCAYRVVRRVFDEGAYADSAFRAEAERARLAPRERAFAQQLAYGTVQRRLTLDHVLEALSSRPLGEVDPPLRDALRLGLHQLLFLDSVPDHAAVEQTVELAKPEGRGAAGFANAVMRRAAREAPTLLARLDGGSPAAAALLHSHPEWLVELWWEALGPEETVALLARDNEAPESAVRANELRTTREELREALRTEGVASRPAPEPPEPPEALVLATPYDVHRSPLFERGDLVPQSRGSMTVARVLDPRPGERVLDMCAAPGAKTTHLAALMRGRGELLALERHPRRAEALERTCARAGASFVEVRSADAADAPTGEPFDRVLLDAPCSSLGTLQARPDARWTKTPESIDELAGLQRRLLEAAAGRLRPGGALVYSTCTISPRENEQQVHDLLASHPELSLDDLGAGWADLRHPTDPRLLLVLPHRHGTDGFFMARIRRT